MARKDPINQCGLAFLAGKFDKISQGNGFSPRAHFALLDLGYSARTLPPTESDTMLAGEYLEPRLSRIGSRISN